MISSTSSTFMLLFVILAVILSSLHVDANSSTTIKPTFNIVSESTNFEVPLVPLVESNSDASNQVDGEDNPESSFARDANSSPDEKPPSPKAGPTYGSCYLELNGTGDLANSCLKQQNSDHSIVNVFLSPDEIKPADIGMFCSLWIKAKICEIKSTCEKCPNEGALAEHFLKDSARRRYDKYCHDTEVTFSPLEGTLCDVTPSSKTGLIISVVVLVFFVIAQCAFICFIPSGGKAKKLEGPDGKSSSSSKGKYAPGAAGSKAKPTKTK